MYPSQNIDLSRVVFHEAGHIVADAKKGRLFRVMKLHFDGTEGNIGCFGWRQPFPGRVDEALERTQDERERQQGIIENLFATLTTQAQAAQMRAQADKAIPLSDLFMTYAAGYEAEIIYVSESERDTIAIESIRREAEQSQDYANMRLAMQDQGYAQESQWQTHIEQAKQEARELLADSECASLWRAVATELMQVLQKRSDAQIEHQIKWYELTVDTREALVELSEYSFDIDVNVMGQSDT